MKKTNCLLVRNRIHVQFIFGNTLSFKHLYCIVYKSLIQKSIFIKPQTQSLSNGLLNLEKCKAYEFPSFNKLEVTHMNSFTEKERAGLGEFFDGTTPVVPNFLRFLYLDGGNEMLLLFIDKLVYTLNVVTEEIRITNFSIDESTLCKVFEASCKVKRLSLRN